MKSKSVYNPKPYLTCSLETAHILSNLGIQKQDLEHECIDAIESLDKLGKFPRGMFHMGNAIKYLWRAGKKGDAVEDLKKALWYVERYRLLWIGRHWWQRLIFGHGGKPYAKLVNASDQIQALIEKIESTPESGISEVFVKVDPLQNLQDGINIDVTNKPELTGWD